MHLVCFFTLCEKRPAPPGSRTGTCKMSKLNVAWIGFSGLWHNIWHLGAVVLRQPTGREQCPAGELFSALSFYIDVLRGRADRGLCRLACPVEVSWPGQLTHKTCAPVGSAWCVLLPISLPAPMPFRPRETDQLINSDIPVQQMPDKVRCRTVWAFQTHSPDQGP